MGQSLKGSFRKIVVVEDDPTMLFFWGRILKDLGVEDYELFSDAVEAKMLLQEIPCTLLISDIVMPGAYGYELARIARRRNPACTIVLTTGYGTDLSRFDLSDCRFHLLHKPYGDISALKVFLRHIIDGDNSFDDLSEDSFSENEDYPQVTEWKL
ncbi:MAG TPA: response regulator [bacterium]|nr:response regulator [bacterium]